MAMLKPDLAVQAVDLNRIPEIAPLPGGLLP